MEPEFAFPIALPPPGSRELLRCVHAQLRSAILNGRLQPGLRLPTTRAFAATYGVSRNVAVATYDLLTSEGYLLTRGKAGTFVADALPQLASRRPAADSRSRDRRLNAFWRAHAPSEPASPLRLRFDFRLGIPDQEHFPFQAWQRLSARALRAWAKAPEGYASPQGQPALREAIAKHAAFARAVACQADDVVVTAGAQQAFDLLARVLVTAGRTVVAMENPGYPPMRAAFAAAGAQIVPVRVDAEGLVVESLPRDARVICVMPSHQFPLGVVMSARRRAGLLGFAQQHRAVVIEDDYDGEYRFGGRPLDALQTLDRGACVFYVGTFSKSLFPALRLGFVVAPPWARAALTAAKQDADSHSAPITQDTLAAFIGEGHLARHVRKMRRIYASRRDLLLRLLRRDLSRWFEVVPGSAGLHLTAFANAKLDVDSIVQRARQSELGIHPLRPYYVGRPQRQGLVFGYGAIDEAGIAAGLARLRRLCSG
ncbi:MAG TPA: PLP-dependent aminotransferase family protein [Rhodanobacteraceae bacterium]|nr:PLP-dependent aminotransferase family protein [Rhodanobacteraceae bacterium]